VLLEENNFITLKEEEGKVIISVHKPGYPLKEFDGILRRIPRIKISNFIELKKALINENETDIEIGQYLPSVELELTNDLMSAQILVHETISYEVEYERNLNHKVTQLLREYDVTYGIQGLQIRELKTSKPC